MKRFIFGVVIFISPAFVFLLLYIVSDPFKIIYNYDNYYSNNSFVNINRSVINTITYLKNRDKAKYNAFLFGSSRTLAVSTKDWAIYLPKDAKTFHYDGYSESVYGVNRKIKFIDSQNDSIKYAIIFLDQMFLEEDTEVIKGHLFVGHPRVNEISWINYHLLFLKAFANPKFFIGYYYYRYYGEYRNFMGSKFLKLKYPFKSDSITSDLIIGIETEIKNDSIGYYSKLQYMADLKNNVKPQALKPTEQEIKLLKEIKSIFDKHKTKYKIVSNPFISQFSLCKEQKELLENIFGKENVYDFSGKSRFSYQIDNFYDPSHFRPKVAKEIFKEVYSK